MITSALERVPAIMDRVRIMTGRGNQHAEHVADFLRSAAASGEPVYGETFKLGHAGVLDALEAVSRRGGLHVVADHDTAVPVLMQRMGQEGLDVAGYGAALAQDGRSPLVNHGKGWSTRQEMLFTTASLHGPNTSQINISLGLGRPQAEAFARVNQTTIHGSPAARLAALEDARQAGVVLNDPELGVRLLDDAMRDVIRGADRNLKVTIKEFLEPSWADELAAARARGVDVRVVTRQIDPESRAILKRAGASVRPVPLASPPGVWRHEAADSLSWRRLHVNVVSADDDARVVVGSRYFWEPSEPGDRIARELGVVLGGDAARDVSRTVDELVTARSTLREAAEIVTGEQAAGRALLQEVRSRIRDWSGRSAG